MMLYLAATLLIYASVTHKKDTQVSSDQANDGEEIVRLEDA